MRRGAVRERWCGRKGFVLSQKGAGVHQGKGGQQDPHRDPEYTGLSWQVLPRDPAQRGEKLLPLLVPDLRGGRGGKCPSPEFIRNQYFKERSEKLLDS